MLDVRDRIRAGVEVRGDVRGEEDRHALLLTERPERVQQLVTRDRVEPGRRLVEDQQLRPVRHGGRQLILDLHALRQLADALALVERKLPDEARVAPVVPPGVKALRDVRQLAQALALIIRRAAGDEADARADLPLVLVHIQPADRDRPRIRMHQMEHGFERGRLARAVAADQAHDRPGLHGERDVFQPEGRILLAKPVKLQDLHRLPPPLPSGTARPARSDRPC